VGVLDHFDVSALDEVTFELSPADASSEYLLGLHSMGIRRLSISALAFFPEELSAMRAPHSAPEVGQALDRARAASIDDLSIDLAFGWASQDLELWQATLRQVVQRQIPHVTLIEMTPPPHSPVDTRELLARKVARFYKVAMRRLQEAGYEHYDIAHFARPGRRAVHNHGYANHANYVGFGPSARSFWWTDREAGGPARRWSNVADLKGYVKLLRRDELPVDRDEEVPLRELAGEYVLGRLGTTEGLDLDVLATRYDYDLRTAKAKALKRLLAEGYLEHPDDEEATHLLRLTERGKLVADAIMQYLMPS
jgi:oxygen-independent coproporphyrinogen-3 oxidase